jgi:hypothetical protein
MSATNLNSTGGLESIGGNSDASHLGAANVALGLAQQDMDMQAQRQAQENLDVPSSPIQNPAEFQAAVGFANVLVPDISVSQTSRSDTPYVSDGFVELSPGRDELKGSEAREIHELRSMEEEEAKVLAKTAAASRSTRSQTPSPQRTYLATSAGLVGGPSYYTNEGAKRFQPFRSKEYNGSQSSRRSAQLYGTCTQARGCQ